MYLRFIYQEDYFCAAGDIPVPLLPSSPTETRAQLHSYSCIHLSDKGPLSVTAFEDWIGGEAPSLYVLPPPVSPFLGCRGHMVSCGRHRHRLASLHPGNSSPGETISVAWAIRQLYLFLYVCLFLAALHKTNGQIRTKLGGRMSSVSGKRQLNLGADLNQGCLGLSKRTLY